MKSMKGETIAHASVFLVANKDSITIKAFLDAWGKVVPPQPTQREI